MSANNCFSFLSIYLGDESLQVLTWDITLHTDVIVVSKIAKGYFVFGHAYVIIMVIIIIIIIIIKTMITIIIIVMVISIIIP